jgi:hypothetical protein
MNSEAYVETSRVVTMHIFQRHGEFMNEAHSLLATMDNRLRQKGRHYGMLQ